MKLLRAGSFEASEAIIREDSIGPIPARDDMLPHGIIFIALPMNPSFRK
jgi:hypothetical protein